MKSLTIHEINKFLIQCQRIAPSLTTVQIAMIFEMYEHNGVIAGRELAKKLRIKPAMVNRYLKPLFDIKGRKLVSMEGWEHLELTELGKRYCRSLQLNAKYFFKDILEEGKMYLEHNTNLPRAALICWGIDPKKADELTEKYNLNVDQCREAVRRTKWTDKEVDETIEEVVSECWTLD